MELVHIIFHPDDHALNLAQPAYNNCAARFHAVFRDGYPTYTHCLRNRTREIQQGGDGKKPGACLQPTGCIQSSVSSGSSPKCLDINVMSFSLVLSSSSSGCNDNDIRVVGVCVCAHREFTRAPFMGTFFRTNSCVCRLCVFLHKQQCLSSSYFFHKQLCLSSSRFLSQTEPCEKSQNLVKKYRTV